MGRLTSALRVAVVAILAAWAVFFSLAPLRGLFWTPPGYFYLGTDSSLTVVDVDSDSAAYREGIRVGDRFDGATTSFEDRLFLQRLRNPPPGQPLTLRVRDANGWRFINLRATTSDTDASEYTYYFIGVFIDLLVVLAGSIVLLLRPSTMTWAFFLYCVGVLPALFFISFWLPSWLNFGASAFGDALRSFGYGAFLVFCCRAPSDRVIGRWRYLESIVAPLVTISLLACSAVTNLSILGVAHADLVAGRIQSGIAIATYVLGMLALIATFSRERGLERNRIVWIVAGFAIGLGSIEAANLANLIGPFFPPIPGSPSWLQFMPLLLPAAIPLTVGYAVVRHHALNVGFIAKRTLVYGLLLIVLLATLVLLDIFVTKKFANNQFEVGIDVAIALAMGLSFQFLHPQIVRTIDRLFLPESYQAAIALERLRTTLAMVRTDDDSPARAIAVVAKELSFTSLAIFGRVPDGGFVRYASAGWHRGATWHLYDGDPLLQSFAGRSRVTQITEKELAELNVPLEPGRPKVGMSLWPQTAAESLILVGAHVNGRRPGSDEVRGVALLLREFAGIGLEGAAPARNS